MYGKTKLKLTALLLCALFLFSGTSFAAITPGGGAAVVDEAALAADATQPLRTITLNGTQTSLDISGVTGAVIITCTSATTLTTLKTSSNISGLTVNGNNMLTIKEIDTSAPGVTMGTVTFNGTIFNFPGDDLFTYDLGPLTVTNLTFNNCSFTGTTALRSISASGTVNITNCTFKGDGQSGVSEMIHFNSAGSVNVNVTGGSMTNGYILTAGGKWAISGMTFYASAIRVGAADVSITGNSFVSGTNPSYKYGIGFENIYGPNTGSATIKNNVFSNGGVAIAIRDNPNGALDAQNMGSVTATDNDFSGSTSALSNLQQNNQAANPPSGAFTFSNNIVPGGAVLGTFFGGAKNSGSRAAGFYGTGSYVPPNPVITTPVTPVTPVEPETPYIGKGVVNVKKLTVYASNSSKAKKLGTMYLEDLFDIYSIEGTYLCIDYNGEEAYVLGNSINAIFSKEQSGAAKKKMTAYSEPKASSKYKVDTIAKGDEVVITGRYGKFFELDWGGQTVYALAANFTT